MYFSLIYLTIMIRESLISTGNPYFAKEAIERARSGKEITIACIGGSITEGACADPPSNCWASLFCRSFAETYAAGDTRVRLVNAGMGGTPSTLGVIRYDRDVLAFCPQPPDIVIVEFAVNDNDDPTKGAVYESLICNILEIKPDTAIILLFSVFRENRWNLQDRFIPVGTAYDLPMVSIKNAIVPELEAGRMKDADFFHDDGWHPLNYGHSIMCDCLMHCFGVIDETPLPAAPGVIPALPVIGRQFAGIRMVSPDRIPDGVTIRSGSFTANDSDVGTYLFAPDQLKFACGWHRSGGADNEPFVLESECKNMLLVYKKTSASDFGTACVYVNGVLTHTISDAVSNWNQPWTIVLFDETVSSHHRVEIRMAEGHEIRKFTLLAFGVTN